MYVYVVNEVDMCVDIRDWSEYTGVPSEGGEAQPRVLEHLHSCVKYPRTIYVYYVVNKVNIRILFDKKLC